MLSKRALVIGLSLLLLTLCVINFVYSWTHTLLHALMIVIMLVLSVILVWDGIQPPVTIYGACICAEEGTPLDNGIITVDGVDYQNVTVVKCAVSAIGGVKAKTASSGAYTLNVRRGYNLKLMVTATHYHRYGTGPDATLKKCTYAYTELLSHSEVGDSAKVERNFSLAPDTVEELSTLQE